VFPFEPLDQIQEEDLQKLIDEEIQECESIDFKLEMYGGTDEDKREMLRDIASMANGRGGHIFIGVGENGDGAAAELAGINDEGCTERITSSCLSNLDPRLRGLRIRPVPLKNGNCVLVLQVPRSLNGPHRITYKGYNQFWKRHERQKQPMSSEEIGAAFMDRFDGIGKLETFLLERRRRLADTLKPLQWFLLLTATPVFLRDEVLDTREDRLKILLNSPPRRNSSSCSVSCGWPSPTLFGLRAEVGERGEVEQYLELHRTGHLEFATTSYAFVGPGRSTVRATVVVDLVDSFVRLATSLHKSASLYSPSVLGLTILAGNPCNPLELEIPTPISANPRKWTEPAVTLPLTYVDDLGDSHSTLVKRLNDRLWNAFGYDECYLVDAQGCITEHN